MVNNHFGAADCCHRHLEFRGCRIVRWSSGKVRLPSARFL